MTEIQVGKVMLTPKGEYDSTKTYIRLDAVTYQGSSYVCLSDTTSAPPSDSWQVLAQKGTDGKDGQPGHDGKDGKDGQTPDVSNMATKDELASKADTQAHEITSGTLASLGPGEYEILESATDAPTGSWGILKVIAGSRYSQQLYYAVGNRSNRIYSRVRDDQSPDYGWWREVTVDTSGFATKDALSTKADKSQLPDMSKYAKMSDIPSLSGYAKLSDLPTQVPTITSGTLADLAIKNGSYHYEIDFIPSDAPAYNWGMCDVVVGENYAKEVFTDTSTTDVYVRTRKQGVWSAWRQVTLWN